MVVIERARSSTSSSTSSRKEKQGPSCEKESHELPKRKLIRKTSSISSPSTPSKKEKKSGSCLKDTHELLKGKLAPRANSFSSPLSPSKRKGKQNMSGQKDVNNEPPKEKLVRKASSLSSSSNSSMREQRSLSTSIPEKNRKSTALIKSRIKELGPICKRRKEILSSIKLEEDIDVYLDKQIEDEGKANPDDCLWLSSGSMSPQEFGLFMSALDPSLDEWVLSFLPRSSRTPKAFDGSKVINPVCEANLLGRVEKEEVTHEADGSALECSQSIDSSCSSSLALSTSNNSSFWNMDRTGVWVSLINLDVEDSKFISDVDSQMDELESNFPSPNYESNWDSYFSDVGVSSSAKSTTQESTSQSEWSSDLLSDSMDWEMESDDPIFWPYGVDCDWDQKDLDSFSVSPRKGVYKIRFKSGEDSSVTPDSIRFRLQGRNGKRIVFMSGLSASKIIAFKKGCRKNATAAAAGATKGKRCSKIGKRANRFKRRVPPILEDDLEGISPKETPKESLKKGSNSSDMDLSECTDDWGDEMDNDGPLFWPTDQKTADWDVTWDSFNISPRKNTQLNTDLSSPKGGFAISSSVRLKFCPKKVKSKVVPSTKSSLGTSKSFKFKSISQKTNVAAGGRSLVVIIPGKRRSMFKSSNMFFKHGSHGKKKKDMPLKVGKSVEEFIRLVSIIGMNKMFPGNELASENLPIETLVGLGEFDGHEGVDMEFEDDFLLEECTKV
uniref:Uncharacterized protein n=1 Tax=Chenopodium quinoa TaxID=63459 RepID=A0A803LM99_CHEQI